MASRVQRAILEAVTGCAQTLSKADTPIKEKQLEAAFRDALAGRLAAGQTACSVDDRQLTLKLAEWPGVGPVDVAVRNPIGDPLVLAELKWGRDSLFNTVWDLAKMGVASAKGVAWKTILVAGAPVSDWNGARGADVFASRSWRSQTLLQDYEKEWLLWKKAVQTRPLLLPTVISTRLLRSEALTIESEPWSIRAVEVHASPEDWLDVESGIKVSRWITHFTWQPGDVDVLTPDEAR